MLILDGYEINLFKFEGNVFGYQVTMTREGKTSPCYIELKDKNMGYCRVYLGDSVAARNKEVNYYYLHRLVLAYYCGWDKLDIAKDSKVHHILHNEETKEDLKKYNDIKNLVYVNASDHNWIHAYERRILNLKGKYSEEEIEEAKKEREKILKRAIIIRNNTIRKNNPGLFAEVNRGE